MLAHQTPDMEISLSWAALHAAGGDQSPLRQSGPVLSPGSPGTLTPSDVWPWQNFLNPPPASAGTRQRPATTGADEGQSAVTSLVARHPFRRGGWR